MKTSVEWWENTKRDEKALAKWLQRQYIGEVTAVSRIERCFADFPLSAKEHRLINKIITDEKRHAKWIKEILVYADIEVPDIFDDAEDRYWKEPLRQVTSKQKCAAVAVPEAIAWILSKRIVSACAATAAHYSIISGQCSP
jgi:hypothetical protein